MKCPIFIGLFLLLALGACNNKRLETTSCPQEDVLYQVEGFFSQKPDSVLQILDTLNIEVLSEKERAHYCLQKVKVRDALFLYDNETDSLLQMAEDYFVGSKDKWLEAQTCEALSRIAFKEGKGEQLKLEWLQKALQSIEQCQHIDDRLVRYSGKDKTEQQWIDDYTNKIRMRLGMFYTDNGYIKEGLNCLKPVYQYYADNQNQSLEVLSANMLGNAYLTIKEYDSCRKYFEKGMQAAEESGNAERIAYCHFSNSMYHRYRFNNQDFENEEDGRQLLWNAIAECHQGLALYEGPMFYYKDALYSELSRCFYLLEQYDSCIYYAEKQIDFMDAMHFEMVPNPENAAIFQRLYKSHEALGNQEKALEYAHRYFEMSEAIEDQPKAVEQVKNEYDKKLEMMQLQNEQQVKRYRLYLLLALTLVMLLLVLWLTFRYRKNKEIETLKFQKTIQRLQSELEQHSQHSLQTMQQRAFALYQSEKTEAAERIFAEFETSYPQTMEKLKASYPELSEAECKVAILSLLGFRVKEVAQLLDLSANTVTKYRTNIRKKSGLETFSDLIA